MAALEGRSPVGIYYPHLKDTPYQSSPLAKAEVTKEEVDGAIDQLIKWGSDEAQNVYFFGFERLVSGDQLQNYNNYKNIEKDNPLGLLVDKIAKQIRHIGVPINIVSVRFEKGLVRELVKWWHADDVETVVTVGFSNKEEWNTKMITNQKVQTLSKEFVEKLNEHAEELNKMAETMQLGYLYYGARVFHRSPLASDIHQPISSNDYRLFLRFL